MLENKVFLPFLIVTVLLIGQVGGAGNLASGVKPAPAELTRVKYLARAYIYEPQDYRFVEKAFWDYEDFRPFYSSRIEVQIDDYYASQIRNAVLTDYDIVILTTPRDKLSQNDRALLDSFEASKGIVMPADRNVYDQIPALKARFENGQLKSRQDVYVWEYHSSNLDLYYPEISGWFAIEKAQQNAAILEQYYAFAQDVIDEKPFHGEKISIAFYRYRDWSAAGRGIRMGTMNGESDLVPPSWTFYHEIAHDFTSNDGDRFNPRTSTAAYLDINTAFEEAIANLFAYYFDSTFRYKPAVVSEQKRYWQSKLLEYENRRINPYSLNWHGHNSDQRYLEAMLFHIFESYGWNTWNYFFRIAKRTSIPKIPPQEQTVMEDLTQKDASLALSRLVYLLSLAAGTDLKPQFKAWGFKIEPEIEKLPVNRVTYLALNLSSTSVKVTDELSISVRLTDFAGNPMQGQVVKLYLGNTGVLVTSLLPIGNVTTDTSGQGGITVLISRFTGAPGTYQVVASYNGTMQYGQSKAMASLIVKTSETTLTHTTLTSTGSIVPTQPSTANSGALFWILIPVVIAGVAVFIMIWLRKRKNVGAANSANP